MNEEPKGRKLTRLVIAVDTAVAVGIFIAFVLIAIKLVQVLGGTS